MSQNRSVPPDHASGGAGGKSAEFRIEVGARVGHVLEEFPDLREAAQSLGRSRSQIESYLRGEKAPPFETLARLSEETGVSLDWLATGKGPIMRLTGAKPLGESGGDPEGEPEGAGSGSAEASARVDPEMLALVIRAILEALDEERLTLYTGATAELIALVYDAVLQAGNRRDGARPDAEDPIELAKENLRRVLPLILSGRSV